MAKTPDSGQADHAGSRRGPRLDWLTVAGIPEAGADPLDIVADDVFCPECGTHLVSRAPALPGTVMLKVGTLDDPSVFGGPQVVIYTIDKQSFHHVPEGVAVFERTPG